MIVNVTRIMRQWLEHPEWGLHAALATVPRARVNGVTDDLPPMPTIYDDIDDRDVAEKLDPPMSPALCLYVDTDAGVDVSQLNYQKAETPLTVSGAYVTRGLNPEVAARWGGYTARAFRRSLRRFNDQSLSVTPDLNYRELNGIRVMKVGVVTETRVATALSRSHLWGFVSANVTVIDTLA